MCGAIVRERSRAASAKKRPCNVAIRFKLLGSAKILLGPGILHYRDRTNLFYREISLGKFLIEQRVGDGNLTALRMLPVVIVDDSQEDILIAVRVLGIAGPEGLRIQWPSRKTKVVFFVARIHWERLSQRLALTLE